MCKVFIVKPYEPAVAYDPADLEAKVRLAWFIERMKQVLDPKPAAVKKTKPAAAQRTKCQPAPLQRGGDMVKRPEPYYGYEETHEHWRMRCNASNERKKDRRLLDRWHKVPY